MDAFNFIDLTGDPKEVAVMTIDEDSNSVVYIEATQAESYEEVYRTERNLTTLNYPPVPWTSIKVEDAADTVRQFHGQSFIRVWKRNSKIVLRSFL